MNIELINNWYMSTDHYLGSTDTSSISSYMEHNARLIFDYFSAMNWSLSAIAGMLGNMQVESTLSPAFIQSSHRSQLPNSASDLSDVPNNVMLSFYNRNGRGYGIGLVQWDGYTSTSPAGQKLVSFAIRYNLDWFDGDTQLFRILREQETNIQWQKKTIFGIQWTWSNYVNNTRSPEDSSDIWRNCYEVGGDASIQRRRDNARYWYNYFQNEQPEPPIYDEWIYGEEFAEYAMSYDPDITGVQIPYSQLDCIAFVNKVWKDISYVSENGWNMNRPGETLGTNTLWRSNRTFNTVSPFGQNPTPLFWFKDTIENYEENNGSLPAGCLLWHKIPEDGNPPIPPQYAGDGIGNFAHVGIYIGNGEVMQSGGQDSILVPGGGVHRSAFSYSAWNYMSFPVFVDPQNEEPPDPEPEPEIDRTYKAMIWYTMDRKKREVKRNVRKTI